MLLLSSSESTSHVCEENDKLNMSARHTSGCDVWAGSSSQNHPLYRNQLSFSANSCSQTAR